MRTRRIIGVTLALSLVVAAVGEAQVVAISPLATETVGGISVGRGDVATYHADRDVAELLFAGSAFTSSGPGIDAFHSLPTGQFVLSTTAQETLGGLTFRDGDLVQYDPLTDTAVIFLDEDLFSTLADIDAVAVLPNGNIVLSTAASATLGGLSFLDGDLVEYNPTTDTATILFSESLFSSNADVDAVYVQDDGRIVLSTTGNASLAGVSFVDGDLVRWDPATQQAELLLAEGTIFGNAADITAATRSEPPEPVDVVVYADHIPALDPAGNALTNPFEDSFGHPPTPMLIKEVPGITRPQGTTSWGTAAWAKFVFLGNYDEGHGGGGQVIEDQNVGIFDSESKEYCLFDLQPGAQNASVQWLHVLDPAARQTRIYYNGWTHQGSGTPLGYLNGDLDQNPCTDPWTVVPFTSQNLNDARVSKCSVSRTICADSSECPATETCDLIPEPCPGNFCGLDGFGILHHDTATNKDLLVLTNWLAPSVSVVEVDPNASGPVADQLRVLDVYEVPMWHAPTAVNSNNYCLTPRPVGIPAIDPTRPANDLRFATSGDTTCNPYYPPVPAECAPLVGVCADPTLPQRGIPCVPGDGACEVCYEGQSGEVCLDLCALANPAQRCASSGDPCLNNTFLSAQDSCPDGDSCICQGKVDLKGPAQEYRFDGTNISPTSPFFQACWVCDGSTCNLCDAQAPEVGSVSAATPAMAYSTDGTLFANVVPANKVMFGVYQPDSGGEHAYYNPGNPVGSELHNPDQVFDFVDGVPFFNVPGRFIEVGSSMYMSGWFTLQRATKVLGQWTKDDNYVVGVANTNLPAEAGLCTGGGGCRDDSDCSAGETCDKFQLQANRKVLAVGGSPTSPWTQTGFSDLTSQHSKNNTYILRYALVTPLPDNLTSSRPAITWSGGDCTADPKQCRLWLVAEKDGELKYRVRDDGLWSAWDTIPDGVVANGGVSIISDGTTVQVYARLDVFGFVYTSNLTSSITCDPGGAAPDGCTWSAWTPLPIISTPSDVAATLSATGPVVAVRSLNDDKVWFNRSVSGSFGSWVVIDGLTTDTGPSITYSAASDVVWVAAREVGTGKIKVASITNGTPTAWAEMDSGGAQEPWGTAPAIVASGGRIQLFAAKAGDPEHVYQAIRKADSGWGSWRKLGSGSESTLQPAAADVNGDVNLVTYSSGGIAEEAGE